MNRPSEISVVLADDHAMVRSGLRRIIESEPGLRVSGEAQDGAGALACLQEGTADVVMLDLSMPAPSGPDLIGKIRERWPKLPVLVVSMHNNPRVVRAALQAGANGYVPKDSDPETLLTALRRVAAGGYYVEPKLANELIFLEPTAREPREILSVREFQVFERLAAGQTNHQIAAELFLSEKTVSTHKTKLMSKLGLENMADLVRYADEYLRVSGRPAG